MTRENKRNIKNGGWLPCLLTGVALSAITAAQAGASPGDGNYFFFGDSATGQGNWSVLVHEQGEDHAPYSSNNGFMRETNGLIWAEMLGRDVDIIFDPDIDSSNINFAISGAHMTALGDLSPFGVNTGVQIQTQLFSELVAMGDITPSDDDVFFVLAGANDFLDRFPAGDSIDLITADLAAAAADNVATLADLGAKTILFSEIQPIDYAPGIVTDNEDRAFWEATSRNANAAIAEAISAADIDANIVTVKYRDMLEHITDNAAALGFINTTDSCLADDDTLCAPDKAGQDQYLFLDDLHFTERAQRIEAQWFQSTLDAATGEASRHAARIADVAQYELEAVLRRLGRNQTGHTKGISLYGDFLYDSPLLANGDLRSLVEDEFKTGLLGAEVFLSDNVFAGVAASLTRSEVSSLYGSYDSGSEAVHGYLGVRGNNLSARVGGSYGWLDINDFERRTGVDLLAATGDTKGHFWDAFGEVGASTHVLGTSVNASASFHMSNINVDGFKERGAQGLALEYGDQTRKSRRVELDLRLKHDGWHLSKAVRLSPVVDANYRRELTDGDYTLVSQMLNNTADSALFTTDGAAADRLSGMFGFDVDVANEWRIAARFEKTWADDVADAEAISVSLRWKF